MPLNGLKGVFANDMLEVDVASASRRWIGRDVMRVHVDLEERSHDQVTGRCREPFLTKLFVKREQRFSSADRVHHEADHQRGVFTSGGVSLTSALSLCQAD